MKKILLFVAFISVHCALAQPFILAIEGSDKSYNSIIDSIGYTKNHPSATAVISAVNNLAEQLRKMGYIGLDFTFDKKNSQNNSLHYVFTLGEKVSWVKIYTGHFFDPKLLPAHTNDTLLVSLAGVEPLLKATIDQLEKKGFALASARLNNIRQQDTLLIAELEGDSGQPRKIQGLVFNGYTQFPSGHRKQLLNLAKNKPFTQANIKRLYQEVNSYRFVKQPRFPEVLLTTDSTKVFLYLEKAKANRFDGFIGFANDDENQGKIRFNGYLDLQLTNILHAGEAFTLFWKSDGNNQRTFNVGIELPYLLRSKFGLKGNLQIFRQDSTFQNTKTQLELGYLFDYGMRGYLGYESTESSDIQNSVSATLTDFNSRFFTAAFVLVRFRENDLLFPEKTKLDVRSGIGNRQATLQDNKQFYIDLSAMYNWYLNEKNLLNIRNKMYYLQSSAYLISELARFGGINSIRGFNENSLQGNLSAILLTEYRYRLSSEVYIHSVLDYGWLRDETTSTQSKNNTLLGLGFGLGLLSKNGLFNLVYANGTANDQSIKVSNSIIHLSLKTQF